MFIGSVNCFFHLGAVCDFLVTSRIPM